MADIEIRLVVKGSGVEQIDRAGKSLDNLADRAKKAGSNLESIGGKSVEADQCDGTDVDDPAQVVVGRPRHRKGCSQGRPYIVVSRHDQYRQRTTNSIPSL